MRLASALARLCLPSRLTSEGGIHERSGLLDIAHRGKVDGRRIHAARRRRWQRRRYGSHLNGGNRPFCRRRGCWMHWRLTRSLRLCRYDLDIDRHRRRGGRSGGRGHGDDDHGRLIRRSRLVAAKGVRSSQHHEENPYDAANRRQLRPHVRRGAHGNRPHTYARCRGAATLTLGYPYLHFIGPPLPPLFSWGRKEQGR